MNILNPCIFILYSNEHLGCAIRLIFGFYKEISAQLLLSGLSLPSKCQIDFVYQKTGITEIPLLMPPLKRKSFFPQAPTVMQISDS